MASVTSHGAAFCLASFSGQSTLVLSLQGLDTHFLRSALETFVLWHLLGSFTTSTISLTYFSLLILFAPNPVVMGEVLNWGLGAAEVATFCRQKLSEPWLIPLALFLGTFSGAPI